MDITPEIQDRIRTAANTLYENSGRESFPKVDDVRRMAKASMNDTSAVMKLWRREQMNPVAVEVEDLPKEVEEIHAKSLQALWQVATEYASKELEEVRASHAVREAEAEALRHELSEDFQRELEEKESIQNMLEDATNTLDQVNQQLAAVAEDLKAETELREDAETLIQRLEAELAEVKANNALLKEETNAALVKCEAANELTRKLEAKQESDVNRMVASHEKATATLVQQHEKASAAKDAAMMAEKTRAEKQWEDVQQQLREAKADQAAGADKREQQAEQLGELRAKLAEANSTLKTLQKPKKKS